jgi:hypothetical protein
MVSHPDTDGLSLTIITLAPGALLLTHRHDVDEGASIADFRAYTFYKTDYVDPPEKWATAQVAFGKLLRDPGATPDRARVPGAADHTVLPRKSNLFRSDVTRIDRDGRQREEPVQGVPAEI